MQLTCPVNTILPDRILLGHGSGGKMTSQLIEHLFLPAFQTRPQIQHDGAFLEIGGQKLVFTTDSYVVSPLFFPGGNIGDLAVNGTINDLAMCGAAPSALSCAFILEEGFSIDQLRQITQSMSDAALAAKIKLVTGDTKVVEKGKGDGLYLNTSGIGLVTCEPLHPGRIQPGDLILVNGDIGRHGTAILSAREGLAFDSPIESDTQELYSLVHALQQQEVEIHCLRDLTRGGLATVLAELAEARGVLLEIDEMAVPVHEAVKGACEFLGLDPLYVACEGRMAAFVAPDSAEKALEVMRSFGNSPRVIGEVRAGNPIATAKTAIGTKRIIDLLSGEQLPRIC